MNEKKEIIKKYKDLVKNLKKHNNFYFNEDNPKISDADYDELKKEIIKLEKKYDYLAVLNLTKDIVGANPSNKFKKVTHLSPMLSLSNAFNKNDRDVLEPFGINPIVFERGAGIVIKGNKTAQQSIQSALSSAHVREVLIYIEDGLAAILQNYLFEFNTAQTRLEIKTLADSFMESVRTDQGIYDYRNIMDTTNKKNEVIDNNMGILDTYVEPVKGLEILVSRVTVLNTGDIEAGNFG